MNHADLYSTYLVLSMLNGLDVQLSREYIFARLSQLRDVLYLKSLNIVNYL